jgi:outer membrane usher protein
VSRGALARATGALAALVVCAVLSSRALAGPDLERAVFHLELNGVPFGDTLVLLRGTDVLVSVRDLERAGLARLTLEKATATRSAWYLERNPIEEHAGTRYVSLQAASPPLRYKLDHQALFLRIVAPPHLLSRTEVDVGRNAPTGIRYTDEPSAFVNYAPRVIDYVRFEGFGEVGIGLGPALLASGASYDPDNGPVRILSQLVVDDRPALRRVTVGDGFVASGPLGGGALIGGLSLAHRLDIDPYLVQIPRLGYTGSVASPSTVDVYVNDALVQRVPIPPGEFRIANLVPVGGEGTARYVIRDAFGREQRVESAYYSAPSVLAAGLQEYHYAAGFLREELGTASFVYDGPAFLGRHRYGLGDAVTGGARLEGKLDRLSGGLDLAVAPGFGQVEIGAAASVAEHPDETVGEPLAGGAGLLGWSYSWRPLALGTVARFATPRYATVSLAPAADRALFEHTTSAGWSIGPRVACGANVAWALARDAEPQARFRLHMSTRIFPEATLFVAGTESYVGAGVWQYDFRVTLSLSLPWEHIAQASYLASSAGPEVSAQLSRFVPGENGVGYQVAGALAAKERLSAALQARAPIGRYDASYTNIGGDQHSVLQWAGGVAFVPGAGVYLTRPIENGFAVVEVPESEGVRVYRDNQLVGRTNERGQRFVPGLIPYYGNRLRIEPADLPLDRIPSEEEILVAPPPRGGAHVVFDVERVRLVRGRIAIHREGAWRWARLGEIRVMTPERTLVAPLGKRGEMELEGLGPGRWAATVVSPEGSCRLELVVPEGDALVQNLGTLRCSAAPAGAPAPKGDR